MKKYLLGILILQFSMFSFSTELLEHEKTRVMVLTDISNEPDDAQSLVRFLTYSNMFDIEGVIATTSYWLPDQIKELEIMRIMRAYGRVRDNLALHEQGFPTQDQLLKKSLAGKSVYGMQGVGHYSNSEGSMTIINSLKNDDDRPLWVLVWGGSNTLAQALFRLDFETNDEEFKKYTSKLRVYAISDQDDSGPWIRNTYPDIFYICSPGYAHDGKEGYHFATWSGISGDTFHGRFQGANAQVVSNEWLRDNIQENHGMLGQEYPSVEYLMEGDTPSFLYLINNGLGSTEHPNYGSWGGRYEYYTPKTERWFFTTESNPLWTNAVDEVKSTVDNNYYTSNHATIWRWREDFQNDFAARMDWCVKSYEEANHPPVPELGMPNEITVQPGELVELIANSGSDPDGDELSYEWIYYREAGNSVYWLEMENEKSMVASFKAPNLSHPNSMHFILRVTDNGSPALSRYKRVIVHVEPEDQKPRVIVTTDGEVDDKSSFIRYLMYSNEFKTEGLIYGNSKWQVNGQGITWMQQTIDLWDKYRENLTKHMDGYPTAKELKAVVYDGNRNAQLLHSHEANRTLGSQRIIDVLLDKDPSPVWIQAWGGTNTIAQALSILKENYYKEDVEYALSKIKIFAIADQDDTGEWIRKEFPNILYIRSHQFTALNYQHEGHPFSNASIFSEDWMTDHVKTNHGELGESYPQKYFSEGDSPAFLHLINNGLRADENPAYGGWGGRFETQNGSHYFDATDNGDNRKGQWRWLLDIQNDFAARMDWCIGDYTNANHYPEIILDSDVNIHVKSGEKLVLDASKSVDPDGNTLNYEWYYYDAASSLKIMPKLKNNRSSKFTVSCPLVSKEESLHILLEVTDDGVPALKKYKRVIVTIQP